MSENESNTKTQAQNDQERVCSLARYSDLFLRIFDMAVILDADTFTILDVNEAAELALGLKNTEILNKSFINLIQPQQKEVVEKILRIVRRKYYPLNYETDLIVNEKEIPVRITGCNLTLTDGRAAIQLVVKDIRHERATKEKMARYVEELERLNKKLELLSCTDGMTGLANFRFFNSRIQEEHERSERYKLEYSLIFIDVDNFKHFNDRNGHPAGDEVLKKIATILTKNSRKTDFVSRYGGEEFVIICPETSQRDAVTLAEKIRNAVRETKFEFGEFQPLGHVSISMGVSTFPHYGATPCDIIKFADECLYISKTSGRDRVTFNKVLKMVG